jgi:hypothetical protein
MPGAQMVGPFHASRALRAPRVAVNCLKSTTWRTSDNGLHALRFIFHASQFAYRRIWSLFARL